MGLGSSAWDHMGFCAVQSREMLASTGSTSGPGLARPAGAWRVGSSIDTDPGDVVVQVQGRAMLQRQLPPAASLSPSPVSTLQPGALRAPALPCQGAGGQCQLMHQPAPRGEFGVRPRQGMTQEGKAQALALPPPLRVTLPLSLSSPCLHSTSRSSHTGHPKAAASSHCSRQERLTPPTTTPTTSQCPAPSGHSWTTPVVPWHARAGCASSRRAWRGSLGPGKISRALVPAVPCALAGRPR